jgi:hypothetical protein
LGRLADVQLVVSMGGAGLRDELWEHVRLPHSILVNGLVAALAQGGEDASRARTKAFEVVGRTLG